MGNENDDKGQSDGVNISGGVVRHVGSIVGTDIETNSGLNTTPKLTKASPEPAAPFNSDEEPLPPEEKWNEDVEQGLANRKKLTQPVGEKVISRREEEDKIFIKIGFDVLVNESTNCSGCGKGLSSNPYKKTCEQCGAENQQRFNRDTRIEIVQKSISERQVGTEQMVRELIQNPYKLVRTNSMPVHESAVSISLNMCNDIVFENAIALDSVSLKMCSRCKGTIIVPPTFKQINYIQCGSDEADKNDITLKRMSWAEIYQKVNN